MQNNKNQVAAAGFNSLLEMRSSLATSSCASSACLFQFSIVDASSSCRL